MVEILENIFNWFFTICGLLIALYTCIKQNRPSIKVNTLKNFRFEFINQGNITQTITEIGLIVKWYRRIVFRDDLSRKLSPTKTSYEPFNSEIFQRIIQEYNIKLPLKCRQYVKTSDGKTFKSKKLIITKSSLEEIDPFYRGQVR